MFEENDVMEFSKSEKFAEELKKLIINNVPSNKLEAFETIYQLLLAIYAICQGFDEEADIVFCKSIDAFKMIYLMSENKIINA